MSAPRLPDRGEAHRCVLQPKIRVAACPSQRSGVTCAAIGLSKSEFPRNTAPTIYAPLLPRGSEANTLRTSDWDMPNCRAILDGVMPASKAARTALTCPRANETFVNSARRLSFDDDRSGSTGGFGLTLGGNLPRRFASSTDAVISRSNSMSVRCLTAVDRSLGKTCRCEVLSVAVVAAETSGKEAFWANWVENRSAVGG